MIRDYDCKIVLADGSEYRGCRFGARGDRVCEIVFNTSWWATRRSCPTRPTPTSWW